MSEAYIQALVHEHPACLPIAEIDAMFSRPVPICTELNTPAGPIFSATSLGVMQAAYDGALAYLTGRMPGAPVPHTELLRRGRQSLRCCSRSSPPARSTTEQSRRPGSMLRWRRSSAPGRRTSPCSAQWSRSPRSRSVSVAAGPSSSVTHSSVTHATRGPPRSCARGLRRSRCSRPGRPRWLGRAGARWCRGVTLLTSVAKEPAQRGRATAPATLAGLRQLTALLF